MFFELTEEEKNIRAGVSKEYTPLEGTEFKTKKEEQIVTMYKNGMSVADIEGMVNVSRGLIYTVLNNYKVPKRNNNTKLADKIGHILNDTAKINQIIHDYKVMPLKEVYKKHSIHKNGLYFILDLYQVKRKLDDKDEVLAGKE